jgi:hypothetical protein
LGTNGSIGTTITSHLTSTSNFVYTASPSGHANPPFDFMPQTLQRESSMRIIEHTLRNGIATSR